MSRDLAVEFPFGTPALTGYLPPVARRSESAGDLVTLSSWPRPAGRWRFLADASSLLDASLDYEQTLASTARLAVPEVADYCVVVLHGENGADRCAHAFHRDPGQQAFLDGLCASPMLGYTAQHPAIVALRTGEPQLVPLVGNRLVEWWQAPHLGVVEALAPTSCIAVPLIARERTLGALVFALTLESGRHYGLADLELARDVARRAASAIDHALLYRAAERAARARDDLMAVVAHDLKNPLNTIKLSLERLLENVVPEDPAHRTERDSLGAIVRATERMHRLIRDLLDLARADGGRLLIRPAPVEAADLVRDAVYTHVSLAAAKDIALQAAIDPPIARALADRERIAQVFSNLIDNALKFTPRGGRVTVGASRENESVRFTVEDTGPGISLEDQAHVFDRFWQARNAARWGTGLGLSIARAIVEAHGGTIGVESSPGQGSRFHFSLPWAPA